MRATEAYIIKSKSTFNLEKIDENKSIPVDLNHVLSDDEFKLAWPGFSEELCDKPFYTLNCMGLAAHKVYHISQL